MLNIERVSEVGNLWTFEHEAMLISSTLMVVTFPSFSSLIGHMLPWISLKGLTTHVHTQKEKFVR